MLVSLKREYAQLVTSGGQLFLLFAGLKLHTRIGWLWCLGIMASVSLFAWYSALYRLRAISGTPTSRIGSAAQGYVELIGHGEPHDDRLFLISNYDQDKLALRHRLWVWAHFFIFFGALGGVTWLIEHTY